MERSAKAVDRGTRTVPSKNVLRVAALPRSYRCHFDHWLDEAVGIKGMPIPYGAPNASPHVERSIRTLREEAPDHFIFLGISHVLRVLSKDIRYYNVARPS